MPHSTRDQYIGPTPSSSSTTTTASTSATSQPPRTTVSGSGIAPQWPSRSYAAHFLQQPHRSNTLSSTMPQAHAGGNNASNGQNSGHPGGTGYSGQYHGGGNSDRYNTNYSNYSFGTHNNNGNNSGGGVGGNTQSKTVCRMDCRHCTAVVCLRGMKAMLLADTSVELYSTDHPPGSVRLIDKDYTTSNCRCKIRDVACRVCGNVIGYHITQPCQQCLKAPNNGHFWMFHTDGVVGQDRLNMDLAKLVHELVHYPLSPAAQQAAAVVAAADAAASEGGFTGLPILPIPAAPTSGPSETDQLVTQSVDPAAATTRLTSVARTQQRLRNSHQQPSRPPPPSSDQSGANPTHPGPAQPTTATVADAQALFPTAASVLPMLSLSQFLQPMKWEQLPHPDYDIDLDPNTMGGEPLFAFQWMDLVMQTAETAAANMSLALDQEEATERYLERVVLQERRRRKEQRRRRRRQRANANGSTIRWQSASPLLQQPQQQPQHQPRHRGSGADSRPRRRQGQESMTGRETNESPVVEELEDEVRDDGHHERNRDTTDQETEQEQRDQERLLQREREVVELLIDQVGELMLTSNSTRSSPRLSGQAPVPSIPTPTFVPLPSFPEAEDDKDNPWRFVVSDRRRQRNRSMGDEGPGHGRRPRSSEPDQAPAPDLDRSYASRTSGDHRSLDGSMVNSSLPHSPSSSSPSSSQPQPSHPTSINRERQEPRTMMTAYTVLTPATSPLMPQPQVMPTIQPRTSSSVPSSPSSSSALLDDRTSDRAQGGSEDDKVHIDGSRQTVLETRLQVETEAQLETGSPQVVELMDDDTETSLQVQGQVETGLMGAEVIEVESETQDEDTFNEEDDEAYEDDSDEDANGEDEGEEEEGEEFECPPFASTSAMIAKAAASAAASDAALAANSLLCGRRGHRDYDLMCR